MQALRTNLVDTGVGVAVMKIVMQGYVVSRDRDRLVKVGAEAEVEEDRRVLGAALTVVCNCVNDFSPLRTVGDVALFFCMALMSCRYTCPMGCWYGWYSLSRQTMTYGEMRFGRSRISSQRRL